MKKFGFSILSLMLICCFLFIGCSSNTDLIASRDVMRVNYTKATDIVLGEDPCRT